MWPEQVNALFFKHVRLVDHAVRRFCDLVYGGTPPVCVLATRPYGMARLRARRLAALGPQLLNESSYRDCFSGEPFCFHDVEFNDPQVRIALSSAIEIVSYGYRIAIQSRTAADKRGVAIEICHPLEKSRKSSFFNGLNKNHTAYIFAMGKDGSEPSRLIDAANQRADEHFRGKATGQDFACSPRLSPI